MNKAFSIVVGLMTVGACMALISGCATTREDRIRENQALFQSWPEDVQENIVAGRIRVGYTTEMVRIALGAPDRTYIRELDDDEQIAIWGYVTQLDAYRRTWPAPSWVYSVGVGADRWYHRTYARPNWYAYDREYEHLRVEFRDGKVVSIERLMDQNN